jgi:hypothetical protein
VAEYFKNFIAPAVTAVVTLVIREGFPKLWRAYQARYIDPKEAHRQIFLDRANWYKDRASKLAVFHFQLGQEPPPDKFKLAGLVAKLDPHDSREAMKYPDVETLRRYAAEKGAECHQNASEDARNAEEISYRSFIFRL